MTVQLQEVQEWRYDPESESGDYHEESGFKLDPEVKRTWVEALKSGLYGKAVGTLCNQVGGYCCLGVAEDVFGLGDMITHEGLLADDTDLTYYFLPPSIQNTLAEINDHTEGFGDVIAWIEANL